tara:strand:+ start:276 stop:407 length:132 start_codon:yes stop_codon:yes gene_type:complete
MSKEIIKQLVIYSRSIHSKKGYPVYESKVAGINACFNFKNKIK